MTLDIIAYVILGACALTLVFCFFYVVYDDPAFVALLLTVIGAIFAVVWAVNRLFIT